MKNLKNGTAVTRSFYYLQDFNDRDGWETIYNEFGTKKLSDLTPKQYIRLFEIATERELQLLKEVSK